jgi:hypothetical protein
MGYELRAPSIEGIGQVDREVETVEGEIVEAL